MKDIEQLKAKVAAWEQFLAEAQAELNEAMREAYRDRLKAEKMEPVDEVRALYPNTREFLRAEVPDYEAKQEDDPLYSPEAVRDMRAHKETRYYITANGKKHWYMISEERGEYQGA